MQKNLIKMGNHGLLLRGPPHSKIVAGEHGKEQNTGYWPHCVHNCQNRLLFSHLERNMIRNNAWATLSYGY
jgi:hypothetical protein